MITSGLNFRSTSRVRSCATFMTIPQYNRARIDIINAVIRPLKLDTLTVPWLHVTISVARDDDWRPVEVVG